jgi:uncharacterized protein
MEEVIGYLIIFIAAIIFSMFGLGGGVIYTPVLLGILNYSEIEAIPLGLVLAFIIAFSAGITYTRLGWIRYHVVVYLSIATIMGAYIGGLLSPHIPVWVILGGLAAILVFSMLRLFWDKTPANNGEVELGNKRALLAYVLSFFVGILSSILGIGGGVLEIPIMLFVLRMSPHTAIGTSHLIIVITTLAGITTHQVQSPIDFTGMIVPVVLGFIGAQIGSHITVKLDEKYIKGGLATIFGVIALILLYQIIAPLL